MKAWLASMIAIAAQIGTAGAQDAAACAAIEDGNERLLCYDAALRSERTTTATPSRWVVNEDVSLIDDSRTVVLRNQTTNEIRSSYGRPQTGYLIARCLENTTVAYFGAGDHFLSDIQSYGRVTYRIDQEAARTVDMTTSTDNKAIGYWSGSTAIPLLQSLFDKDQLVVRVTPYNESAVTMEFDIGGLKEAIAPLREACNW